MPTLYNDDYFSVLHFTTKFNWDTDYSFLAALEETPCICTYDDLYNIRPVNCKPCKSSCAVNNNSPKQLTLFEENEYKKIDWSLNNSIFS